MLRRTSTGNTQACSVCRFAHLHGAYPVLDNAARLSADLDALARHDLTPLDSPDPEHSHNDNLPQPSLRNLKGT
jgi:hypothetical protein